MEMNGQPLFICNLLPKKYTIVQLDVLSKKTNGPEKQIHCIVINFASAQNCRVYLMDKPFGNGVFILFFPPGVSNSLDRKINQHDAEKNGKRNSDQKKGENFGDEKQRQENGMKNKGLQRQSFDVPVFHN